MSELQPSPGLTTQKVEPPVVSGGKRGSRLNIQLIVGGILVGIVVVMAVISFFWTPFNPVQAVPTDRLLSPSAEHWMGTDRFGRDVFSAVMVGSQITLLVGLITISIAIVFGVPLGIVAGMAGGRLEKFLMRVTDVMMAFPGLLLAIIFGAVFGGSTVTAMTAIGIAAIPAFARVARAGTLQVMSTDYIFAARAANRPLFKIAVRHVLPNISGMLVVQASVNFAIAVLAEAGLSFLGLGTAPPTPSWGRMLQESQQFLASDVYLAVFPGAAIAIAVLGFNLLGDGLRDRFDPKLQENR